MRKSGKGKKKEADAIDEVEELLKLTQEDLLLKLTVNSSHLKSKSKPTFNLTPESNSNAIDPDLDRRFQALRSKPNPNLNNNNNNNNIGVDDLFARFNALKGPNATSSSVTTQIVDVEEEEDEEDEVQKIINWAKDAARLDPSPSSDIEDDEDEDTEDDDSDEDDTNTRVARKKK